MHRVILVEENFMMSRSTENFTAGHIYSCSRHSGAQQSQSQHKQITYE